MKNMFVKNNACCILSLPYRGHYKWLTGLLQCKVEPFDWHSGHIILYTSHVYIFNQKMPGYLQKKNRGKIPVGGSNCNRKKHTVMF